MTVVRWREEGWWGTQVGEEKNGGMVEGRWIRRSMGGWMGGFMGRWRVNGWMS